jgi:hypothetical protein
MPHEKIVLRQASPLRVALTLSLRVSAGRSGQV